MQESICFGCKICSWSVENICVDDGIGLLEHGVLSLPRPSRPCQFLCVELVVGHDFVPLCMIPDQLIHVCAAPKCKRQGRALKFSELRHFLQEKIHRQLAPTVRSMALRTAKWLRGVFWQTDTADQSITD
ncbi:hypothetical protein GWK47_028863 [Chionoecetes opilio]|uniref:Uncharacterized protein n=1 Tax=Chionoecetes opilio TaxID=41210 RepID=A0A8J4YNJ5_CHIOP|nr:hypothetical protein GWK47_028863 [Chionoecetes opilio]